MTLYDDMPAAMPLSPSHLQPPAALPRVLTPRQGWAQRQPMGRQQTAPRAPRQRQVWTVWRSGTRRGRGGT